MARPGEAEPLLAALRHQLRGSSVGRFLMLPGMLLQRLTTREPDLADTRVALRAVALVLSRR